MPLPNFLDTTGLARVWGSIVDKFAKKDQAIKSITRSGTTFTATRCDDTTFTFDQQDNNSTYPNAITNITRSGTTFTATRYNGGTFTFTQQDSNTTYSAGTGITLSGTTFSNKYAKTKLYDNATGTNGTVTLSASAANYNHMRIFYRTSDSNTAYASNDVYSPNGKRVNLTAAYATTSSGNFKSNTVTISGTSITKWGGFEHYLNGGAGYSNNGIYIIRVEGWNE